jgi:hypothetical protein
LVKGIG